MRTCSIEGCQRKHSAKGLCLMHYKRLKYHGSLERSRWGKINICKHCDRPVRARGFCFSHYYSAIKHGDPLYIENRKKEMGDRYVDTKGYLVMRVKGSYQHGDEVHRIITKAGPGQVVHHINGIKLDNTPDNLHVFDTNSDHRKAHISLEEVAMELVRQGVIKFDRAKGVYHL